MVQIIWFKNKIKERINQSRLKHYYNSIDWFLELGFILVCRFSIIGVPMTKKI